jgi:hypothetical protein
VKRCLARFEELALRGVAFNFGKTEVEAGVEILRASSSDALRRTLVQNS